MMKVRMRNPDGRPILGRRSNGDARRCRRCLGRTQSLTTLLPCGPAETPGAVDRPLSPRAQAFLDQHTYRQDLCRARDWRVAESGRWK
jgi:hypothetical protein